MAESDEVSDNNPSGSQVTISRAGRLALIATFFFALMQIGVKYLHRLPAQEIVFFRALFLLAISFSILKRKGIPLGGVNKPVLLARGLSGAAALFLFFYTLQHVPLATAVTLQYLSPIFTILFAPVIMGERASWRQWLAFLVAMGGVVLVKGFDPRVSIFHAGLGVLSAICSGLAYNFIRRLKDTDHPDVVVMYFPLITIPVVIPFLFGRWIWPTPLEWFIIAIVGVCTQVAQMCMTRAYQLEKAADVIIFKYTGIVYALVFGFVLFGETMQVLSILGMVIVVAAVYMGTVGRRAQRHIGPSAESWPQTVKPDK